MAAPVIFEYDPATGQTLASAIPEALGEWIIPCFLWTMDDNGTFLDDLPTKNGWVFHGYVDNNHKALGQGGQFQHLCMWLCCCAGPLAFVAVGHSRRWTNSWAGFLAKKSPVAFLEFLGRACDAAHDDKEQSKPHVTRDMRIRSHRCVFAMANCL